MKATAPWQYHGDDKTDIDSVHALWGGPKYIELWNNDAAAWVPGSLYMIDFTAGALSTYGNPSTAIIAAATVAGQHKSLGIAVDATAQGAKGRIQVYGKYAGANVLSTSGPAAGDLLVGSLTTAGRLIKWNHAIDEAGSATLTVVLPIALCLTTPASNQADIFIFNKWGI